MVEVIGLEPVTPVSYTHLTLPTNNRARTCDPLLAKQVLYQLSYTPASGVPSSAKASFAFLLSPKKESGGPKWTRTTDLTIISRAL